MKNNEIGVAAIKLLFTIILILAIIFGATALVKKLWNENNEKDIITDLLYIQAKCKVIYDKHLINNEEPLIGEKITEYTENETIDEIIKAEEKDWYRLKQDDLEKMGEGYLKEEDGYLINYETEEVVYMNGINNEEQTFYKLSDILKIKEQNITATSQEIENNTESVNEQSNETEENNQEQMENNEENTEETELNETEENTKE